MTTDILEHDRLYTRDYKGTIGFGDLPETVLINIFKDGRFATEFISRDLESYFSNLSYVDKTWYDFITPEGVQVEQKQLTIASGFKFCPSHMIGKGRKVDRSVVETYIKDNDLQYLVVSTINFPIIHIRMIPGVRLLELFPQSGCGSEAKNIYDLMDMPNAIKP